MPGNYLKNLSISQKIIFSLISIFFIINVSILIRSFLINANDIREMVKMARYIAYMKYVIILNIALFSVIISLYYFQIKKLRKDQKAMHQENKKSKSGILEDTPERSNLSKG